MKEVVVQVQDAGFVLNGGDALVLAYGSIRHTTDLDFDAEEQIDMPLRIRRATELIGIEIDENTWWWPKGQRGTRISLRYKVNFFGHDGEKYRLQVDTRYHPKSLLQKSADSPDPSYQRPKTLEMTEIWPARRATAHVVALLTSGVDLRHRS